MSMTLVIVFAVVGTIALVGLLVAGVAGEAREQANGEATATTGKASHLERVRTAELSAKPLLNGSERRVHRILLELIDELGLRDRALVTMQVSLPEMIEAGSRYTKGGAYIAIAEKRVDLVVVDEATRARLAIEYDGPEHGWKKRAASDAVKDAAFDRVGIPLVRLNHRDDDASHARDLRAGLTAAFVDELVGRI